MHLYFTGHAMCKGNFPSIEQCESFRFSWYVKLSVHRQKVEVTNAESTKRRTTKHRKTKRLMGQNVEWKKTPNGTKRRMEKTSTRTKGRKVRNAEWKKRRMEKTAERDKTSNEKKQADWWKKSRKEKKCWKTSGEICPCPRPRPCPCQCPCPSTHIHVHVHVPVRVRVRVRKLSRYHDTVNFWSTNIILGRITGHRYRWCIMPNVFHDYVVKGRLFDIYF